MRFFSLILALSLGLSVAQAKPKYGPEGHPYASPLSQDHSYFSAPKNAESPYWRLIPYYTAQYNDHACSVASVTMVINAARSFRTLTSEDKLVTQKSILETVTAHDWSIKVGPLGRGVTLDQLASITEESFKKFDFSVRAVTLERPDPKSLATFKNSLRTHLLSFEKSKGTEYILINYLQSAATDDTDAGHIAPVGAFDSKTNRALILDPDREWYEPYWISLDQLVVAMNTTDSVSGKPRGYIYVTLSGNPASVPSSPEDKHKKQEPTEAKSPSTETVKTSSPQPPLQK